MANAAIDYQGSSALCRHVRSGNPAEVTEGLASCQSCQRHPHLRPPLLLLPPPLPLPTRLVVGPRCRVAPSVQLRV